MAENNPDESEQIASRRLAAIIESSDDAIVSKNLDGIVTSWNRAAERMFGYTADHMIGRSIRTIIPADRQSEEDDVLARIRQGVRVDHFETLRQRKDGTLIPISLTISPIRDDAGRIVGASKIARDISERQLQNERTAFLADKFVEVPSEEVAADERRQGEEVSITLGVAEGDNAAGHSEKTERVCWGNTWPFRAPPDCTRTPPPDD